MDLLKRLSRKSPKPILTSYVNNYPENATDVSQLVKELPWRMTAGHWMKPFTGIRPKKIQYLPAPIESHIIKSVSQPDPQISAFSSRRKLVSTLFDARARGAGCLARFPRWPRRARRARRRCSSGSCVFPGRRSRWRAP